MSHLDDRAPEERFEHLFTVFTPTHDRAHTLSRVHESLASQTFGDFEWLVVDDGSTDETADLIARWTLGAAFPIRYFRQEHAGKHVAFNLGVKEARGSLFLTLDSDDGCVPEALETFRRAWESIPEPSRSSFSAVTGLCRDQHGRLVGDRYPRDPTDSDSMEIWYRHGVRGEKWGFQRTDVLRRFLFETDYERGYVPEDLVWHRIAREYRTRYINRELRVYWVDAPSMVHGRSQAKNAAGGRLQHRMVLDEELDWFWFAPFEFLRSAVHYARFSFHVGIGPMGQARALATPRARILWLIALPLGWMVFLKDALWPSEGI